MKMRWTSIRRCPSSRRVRRCPKAGFRKKYAKPAPCKAALEPVWQIALTSRQQVLGLSLAEFADSFGDTSKPCFGRFGSLDGEHNPLLGASGQSIEELRGRHITVEGVLEVGRHRHLTRFGVQVDCDADWWPLARFEVL